MRLFYRCILAALMAATAFAARAEDPPAKNTPESRWSDSAEIVVPSGIIIPGMRRCPAMWKLTKGDSVVWVMPSLSVYQKSATWNSSCFERVLSKANSLILEELYFRPFAPPPSTLWLPGKTQDVDVLSAETYARFRSMARREDVPVEHDLGYRPAWAGFWLTLLVYDSHGLQRQGYPDYVPTMAKSANVHVKRIGPYKGRRVDDDFGALDQAAQEACLNGYMDRIDYDLATVPKASEAWGRGDVRAVLQYYKDNSYRESFPASCLLPDKTLYDYGLNAMTAPMTDALAAALEAQGRSVAVVPIDEWLRAGGVLDHIKARGIEVSAPIGTEDAE